MRVVSVTKNFEAGASKVVPSGAGYSRYGPGPAKNTRHRPIDMTSIERPQI